MKLALSLLPILVYTATFNALSRYDVPWYLQTAIVFASSFAGALTFSRTEKL